MKHAKDVQWQRRSKKHDIEELEEGGSFEPVMALWNRKGSPQMDSKACRASQVLDRYRTVDENQGCTNCKCCEAEGTEKYTAYHCKERREEWDKIPDVVRACEMKTRPSNADWTWQRGLVSYLQSGETWVCSKPRKQKCISESSRSWDKRVESFRNRIAVDGFLKKISGKDAACGRAVVRA